MNILNYEDKNEEIALKKCLEDLNLTEQDIFYQVKETEAKLFKSKKIILNVITKEEVTNFIKTFINELGQKMNIDIKSEVKETEGIYNVLLVSSNNAILIGREGRTINSLQVLLRQAINSKTGMNIKINVDTSNYKAKKLKNLEYEIKRIIKEVQNTKVDAKLDPMNSYERRMVHNLASQFENITSISDGVEPERFVIIKYED